ncbi:MAG TPA: enoyl-CoA hydratase [Candidatus Binatia bacterium]|jgi:enoyl-CoA hydratase/carnithine racemase|nr:enoyl-CoA hydratase [Candidatus Binatia bacterium]
MPEPLLFHKEPPLAWITFNRPERRNAVSMEMWQALPGLVSQVAEDNDVRVLLLRGAGEEAFISGADISQFGRVRSDAATTGEYDRATGHALSSLATLEKPVIAMIHGICFGGGCSVAVMCDLRLCADDARFCIPAARLGIAYPVERGVERLVHIVGTANATEILLTARVYNAEEAYHMGLVNRVLPKADLESYTRDYALKLADNAPLSVAAHKFFVRESTKAANLRDADKIRAFSARCFNSDDYKEGVAAFMQKRRPQFQGK